MMQRLHVSLGLFALSMTGCFGLGVYSQPPVLARAPTASYAPSPVDCPVELRTDLSYPPDAAKYDLVGMITIDGKPMAPETVPELHDNACLWGGDILVLQGVIEEHTGPRGGTMPARSTFAVVRTLRPNETSATFKQLGISDTKLRETAAFDLGCPSEKIEVVDKMEDQGSGRYTLEACGKVVRYKRTGTVYEKVGDVD